jgi:hypothetical protein
MSARHLGLLILSLGAFALLVRCGGATGSSPGADAGGADGAPEGNDGASDAGSDGSFAGFDGPAPCSPDAAFPPGEGATFACGANECHAGSEYCLSATGGASTRPAPFVACRPFLECGPGCEDASPSCACTVYAGSGACTCAEDAGEIFVNCSFP